ncbi:MAG: PKD domain-containing protein, partial [Bacteroidia bacterium]
CGGNVLVLKPAKASGTTLQWYVSATAINPFSTADSIKINKLYKDTFLYISALPLSGCESYRKQVKVKVNQKPKYAVFSKGSIFKGAFNNGTQTEPDEICEASLSEYNLQTPTGFSDTEYGKTWQITKLEITDLTSNKIFEDTTVTWPSSAGSGTIHFLPSATGNKKSLHINIVISNLITGCDTIFERYVDVIPLPKVKWSVNTICEGDMVNFTYSSTGGVSYAWSFGDGNTSTSKNTNHKYFSAGTYMVKLKVTNSTGCTDSFSRNITVHPVPKVDFKIPATVCEGEEFVPENLTSYNGALMYNWNFGDSTISSDSSVKHAFTTPGIYKITLTATTTQSCTRSITKSITVNTKPVASFTAADSVCVGHGVFFRNFTVNAASYLWNFSSGDTFKTTNVTHTFDTAGIYSVRLISYNPNGCTDTFTKKIEVFPLPKPKFEATNICLGDSMYFINKSNTNGQTGTAYLWRFGDGKTSTLENPAHFYSKEGSFNVTLIVKESGNCTDSIVQKVTVGSKPKAAFSYIGACLDNDFVFTDFSTAATGKIISRNWDFGDGNTSSDSLTKHKFLLAGKYTVSLEVVTEFGCRNIIADTVEVFDLPFAQFTADTICAGNATIFTNNSTANTKSLWLFGDGDTSTATSPIHIYQYAGKYLVTLVVQSVKGCIDSLQQSIIILEKPTAEFSYTTSGGTVSFTSDNQNLSSYLWDFGDGDTSTSINPQHTYKANGNYTVKLVTINSSGCTDTILKQIIISNVSLRETVHPSAKIEVFPNPFKTGFNVKYELLKTSHVSIKILDLQGKEILNKDYGTQAAGSFNSYLETGFSAGTYMLQIIIDGKTETKKIIRVK